jgi:penicillin-binding protein 2
MSELFIKREYRSALEIDDFSVFNNEAIVASDSLVIKEKGFLGKYLSEKILNIFFTCLMIFLALILFRSFWLQVIRGSYYQGIAENNRTREKPLLASRGLIYDAQNKPLVKNVPFFDAQVLPKDLSLDDNTRQEQIKNIAATLGQADSEIGEILNKYPKNFKYQVTVKENIDYDQALLLKIQTQNIPGLYIETRNQRQYLYPQEFSHLLGYEGKITEPELNQKGNEGYLFNDYLGKAGLEANYESQLRGKYGQDIVEVDVTGQEKKVLSHQDIVNGQNLVLSIDEKVQAKAREFLSAGLRRANKTKGSLIMMNPNNGQILALVSLPDYDSNLFAGGISTEDYKQLTDNPSQPLFDRALKGEYPSGSCIKPIYAAAALQEKVVTDKTAFLSTGGIMYADRWFFPDWSAGGHGLTDVYRAIAWSVNTYFYIIGGGYNDFKGLGIDNLDKYLKLFGFGSKTGIDLPGESTGLVPDPVWKLKTTNEQWFIGDTYHLAIGQGYLLVTPLQIANMTSAIANGGILYQPQMVNAIFSNDGQTQEVKPVILKQNFIDQSNIDIVKKAMRQTVTLGSAQALNSLSVTSAGKTGTAQWSSTKGNQAWYIGFAPYENPEVAITVLIEEGGEGSSVSVPVVRDMFNWYFNNYKRGN